jgi:hypothetical protein
MRREQKSLLVFCFTFGSGDAFSNVQQTGDAALLPLYGRVVRTYRVLILSIASFGVLTR